MGVEGVGVSVIVAISVGRETDVSAGRGCVLSTAVDCVVDGAGWPANIGRLQASVKEAITKTMIIERDFIISLLQNEFLDIMYASADKPGLRPT
jgi:hypothetical protein